MNLNRKVHPEYRTIKNINIPVPVILNLDNGIPTYVINAGTQDIIKIDLQFNAGNWYQTKPTIARTTNEMLLEGTQNLSSQEIAEKLDFYGAFIHPQPTKDFANIALYTLKKYLPETIKILEEIIKYPTFPEDELDTYLAKHKQKFLIELEKIANLARREFNEQLFGKTHPYGAKVEIEDYNNISKKDLLDFHKKFYNSNNCKIIISGKVDDKDIQLINQHFGKDQWNYQTEIKNPRFDFPAHVKKELIVQKKDVTQSAIRLGKIIINNDHADYHKLNMANTILGGYFGSRLMKKIREDKGYTYGINSVLVTFKNTGYFVILSEVGADVTKMAVEDILIEVKKLREKIVPNDELELVKNYMLGDLLRSFDGAFEIASSFKPVIELELKLDYYKKQIETIKSITSDEIIAIANKYLHEDTLARTIVGKYN